MWQDVRFDVTRVQTSVTANYKSAALEVVRTDLHSFLHDVDHLGHPPGYPLLLAAVLKLFKSSDTPIQFIQITADCTAAVFLYLCALELLSYPTALIAGLFAALSPQFAYNSVLLLPDSLAAALVVPAMYLIARGWKTSRWQEFALAGVLVGISCWFRANALLLAPSLALFVAPIIRRGQRSTAALALVLGATVVIAPITIKNVLIFHRFIPLSLGAGQTLLEGIADYDKESRFNVPKTDLELMQQEAQWHGRPDYAQRLFGNDGIERERERVSRGMAIVRAHPIWFGRVMLERATYSIRLERIPRIEYHSPLSHDYKTAQKSELSISATDLWSKQSILANDVDARVMSDQSLLVLGNNETYGDQISFGKIPVHPYSDYVLRLPVQLQQGRVWFKVIDANDDEVLASTGVDPIQQMTSEDHAVQTLQIRFVSRTTKQIALVLGNNATHESPTILLGQVQLMRLGTSSYQWLRVVRVPLAVVQQMFVTALVLPLTILGLALLLYRKNWAGISMLLSVPAYYLLVQSALHTERRYVYVIQYFFFAIAAFGLTEAIRLANRLVRRRAS
ncbi:MAG: ArnT family glycosyltransferase [Pyrinomonadaceae bacterium]